MRSTDAIDAATRARLREQLIRYFPAFLQLEGELDADWKLDLLERAPTPRSTTALTKLRVSKILERHRARRRDAGQILARLRLRPTRCIRNSNSCGFPVDVSGLRPSLQGYAL